MDCVAVSVTLAIMVASASLALDNTLPHSVRVVSLMAALAGSSLLGVIGAAYGYRRYATAWKRPAEETRE